MKKLLLSLLLLCATVSAFSQEKGTAKDSIPYVKWSFIPSAGIGFAEMVSNDFQTFGIFEHGHLQIHYYPERNFRLETGLGVSHFSQGNFKESEKEYSLLRVATLEVPVRLEVLTPVNNNVYLLTGGGLQFNAPIWHQFKTQDVNYQSSTGGTLNLSLHLLAGIEIYATDKTILSIYGEYGGSFWQKGNYVNRHQATINVGYTYIF